MNRVAQISQQKSRQFSISDWLKGAVPNKPTREELVGSEVFVPDADSCFVLGSIVDVQDDGSIVAQTAEDGRKVTSAKFHARDALDEKEADLVQMTHVDTPNILHTLRKRHADGAVYKGEERQGCRRRRDGEREGGEGEGDECGGEGVEWGYLRAKVSSSQHGARTAS